MSELLAELDDADPPSPQSLTNAIGAITDDVDNLLRERPDVAQPDMLELTGDEAWHLAVVERGEAPDDRRRSPAVGARRPRGPVPHAGNRAARRPPAQSGAAG